MANITSKNDRLTGSVDLPDMLTFPQLAAFRKAHRAALMELDGGGDAEYFAAVLPGVLAVVQRWDVEGIPERPTLDTFPTKPLRPILALLNEIVTAIIDMVREADETPN